MLPSSESSLERQRQIFLNMRPPAALFDSHGRPRSRPLPPNDIYTSKYTILSFVPRNLFEQFRRFANIFFLTLVILQFFPTYQSINPYVAALPLFSVVAATAIKDAFEDYRRHASDFEINSMPTRRLASWSNTNEPLLAKPPTLASTLSSILSSILDILTFFARKPKFPDNRPTHGQIDPETDEFDQDSPPTSAHKYRSPHIVSPSQSSSPNKNKQNSSQNSLSSPDQSENQSKNSPVAAVATSTSNTSKPAPAAPLTNQQQQNTSQSADLQNLECGDLSADWESIQWRQVRVGDILLLRDNEQIPGDMVVLSTSEPEGLCYIETKNLDGETNLKIRKSVHYGLPATNPTELRRLRCCFEYEKPHSSIYAFSGSMAHFSNPVTDQSPKKSVRSAGSRQPSPTHGAIANTHLVERHGITQFPISINNLLLRGCIIRKTGWICGIIVYTGNDTKIRLNSGDTPIKRSLIEVQTNFYILISMIFMVLVSISDATGNILTEQQMQSEKAPWLDYTFTGGTIGVATGVSAFWLAIILYQNLVPISLYITVEIAKSLQSFFIYEDIDMYDPTTNERCLTRSWNLADDLGQIEYIFSDKTGTLTRNIMEFRRCSVNGVVYGTSVAERMSLTSLRSSLMERIEPRHIPSVLNNSKKRSTPRHSMFCADNPNDDDEDPFEDAQLEMDLKTEDKSSQHFRTLLEFFSCLALCHTVLVSHGSDGSVSYKAQSPDEAALVKAAASIGFTLTDRKNGLVTANILGKLETHQVLNVLEFSSSRKRMSVILRRPSGDIVLYCKGADSVIYERLAPGQDAIRAKTLIDLELFAEEGLRTLCIAMVKLDEAQYSEWAKSYQKASIALENRDERLEQVSELIERNMILLGATAIEDKLQEGVPECIDTLLTAGIRLWVLTGDKMETAINIGYSCSLLSHDVTLILIRGGSSVDDEGSTLLQMQKAIKQFFEEDGGSDHSMLSSSAGSETKPNGVSQAVEMTSNNSKLKETSLDQKMENSNGKNKQMAGAAYALVIDGRALFHALGDDARDTFLDLSAKCSTVICCRVSPLQKAQVVRLIRDELGAMCLAIGDGANDVSMIQAAQIGVGIYGEEGLQAAMAADYAISQFRFLSKLVLVHGRWCYGRTARMILDFFFKNMVYNVPLMLFQFVCGYSFQPSYDSYYMILANLVFTSLPVGFLGAFDKDLSAEIALFFPQLYQTGILRSILTHLHVVLIFIESVYYSIVIVFVHIYAVQDSTLSISGYTESIAFITLALAITSFSLANLHVGVSMVYWTLLMFIGIFGSNILVLLFIFIEMHLPGVGTPYYETFFYGTPVFWLTYILTIVMCMIPRFAVMAFMREITPTDVEIAQELESSRVAIQQALMATSDMHGVNNVFEAQNVPVEVPKDGVVSVEAAVAAEEGRPKSILGISQVPSPLPSPGLMSILPVLSHGVSLSRSAGGAARQTWLSVGAGMSHPLPRRSYAADRRKSKANSFRVSGRRSSSRRPRSSHSAGTPPPPSPSPPRSPIVSYLDMPDAMTLSPPPRRKSGATATSPTIGIVTDIHLRGLMIKESPVSESIRSNGTRDATQSTILPRNQQAVSVTIAEPGESDASSTQQGTSKPTAVIRLPEQVDPHLKNVHHATQVHTKHKSHHRRKRSHSHQKAQAALPSSHGNNRSSIGRIDYSTTSSSSSSVSIDRHHTSQNGMSNTSISTRSSANTTDDENDPHRYMNNHYLTTLETGHFTRERGFSFSQSAGAAEAVIPRISSSMLNRESKADEESDVEW